MAITPLFSVIMPIYNLEKYIDRAVKSILNQSYRQLQIIIIDDGSTDQTPRHLAHWAALDDRIEVHRQENQGISAARNFGMTFVKGEYLTFLDGDDWVEHRYIEFMTRAFRQYQPEMVICGYAIDPPNRSATTKAESGILTRKEAINRILRLGGSVRGYTWNKGYLVDLIRANELQFDTDIGLMEDQLFNIQYANLCQRFYFDTQPLYHYIQRPDSIIHGFDLQKVPDNFVANYRILQELNRAKSKATLPAPSQKKTAQQLAHRKARRQRRKALQAANELTSKIKITDLDDRVRDI